MWPWKKTDSPAANLDDDPRWQKFLGNSGPCTCCGLPLAGVFDIGFDHPDPWPHGDLTESGSDNMVIGADILTPDLCQVDRSYYVRCVLQLPIKGSVKNFGFGAWGSLSHENFTAYRESAVTQTPWQGGFSWISNSLPTFETTEFLPANLVSQPDNMRPLIFAHEGTPLHAAQIDGITFDHLLDIYAASGTDVRAHL